MAKVTVKIGSVEVAGKAYVPGDTVELSDSDAQRLISAGIVEAAQEAKKPVEAAAEPVEAAPKKRTRRKKANG